MSKDLFFNIREKQNEEITLQHRTRILRDCEPMSASKDSSINRNRLVMESREPTEDELNQSPNIYLLRCLMDDLGYDNTFTSIQILEMLNHYQRSYNEAYKKKYISEGINELLNQKK